MNCNPRTIKYIAVHCTATPQNTTIQSILNYWKNTLGWKNPGYHYIVTAKGELINLLPEDKVSNGVQGYNSVTVNICYVGGVDSNNKAVDNRTPEQKLVLLAALKILRQNYPDAIIQGHTDFPNVAKNCPSFDAKKEYENI